MSAPAHSLTWQYSLNTAVTTPASMALAMKNALKAFAQAPYTIAGSSNSVAAGMDGVDRWSVVGDIVKGATTATPRSWIVFNHPAGFQVLFDYRASATTDCDLYVSPRSLFTGGTTAARPTATDEIIGWDSGSLGTAQFSWATSDTTFLNIMHTTDGKLTYMGFVGSSGTINGRQVTIWGKLTNVRADWVQPVIAYGNGTSRFPSGWVGTAGGPVMSSELPAGPGNRATISATTEFTDGRELDVKFSIANQISTGDYLARVGLACWNPTMWGKLADLPDMYFTGDSDTAAIHTYGSKQWMKCGHFVLPWDGVTTPTA